MDEQRDSGELHRANRKLTWQLWLFAGCFLVFAFALVPLYNVMCEVTGYGSRKNLTEAATLPRMSTEASREITVEFVSTMPTAGEWEFRPAVRSAKVRTGQLFAATFVAKNLATRAVTGQAVPSVSPNSAS